MNIDLVTQEVLESIYAMKEEIERIESRPLVQKYQEYELAMKREAFLEELGRKYCGEVY